MTRTDEKIELKRVVGVAGLSLNIINITIGAGIFVLPAIVGIELGAYSLFAYFLCGLMMASTMLCYAEIGTRVSGDGGSYAYAVAAFGEYAGFLVNCLAVFGWSILGSAALMNIIADSLAVIAPCFLNAWIRAALYLVLLTIIVLANIRGAKQGVTFVKWITIIKVLPLIGIIIFGFTQFNPYHLHWDHLPSIGTFGNSALALFFAFAGFETALGVSGEIKNPKRTIPLGILFGGAAVLVLYLLLQVVTLGVLGSDLEMAKEAPLAAIANRLLEPIGGTILLVAAAISCYGSVSTDIMSTPRVLFAGANDGLFPAFLAKVHPRFATPYWSIIVFAALIFLFSVSGGFEQLAVLASAAILLIYLLVILATIKLRFSKDEKQQSFYKIPGGLVIPTIGVISTIWLLSSLSRGEVLSTLIFMGFITLIYFIMVKVKNNKNPQV